MVFPDYYKVLPHYYGDTVRKLFLAAAILMLLSVPLFVHFLLPISYFLPLFVVLVIGLAAGFTSPTQKIVGVLDTIVAGAGVVVSGYYAIKTYPIACQNIYQGISFGLSIVFALIFFFAFYYSVKTLRGFFLRK